MENDDISEEYVDETKRKIEQMFAASLEALYASNNLSESYRFTYDITSVDYVSPGLIDVTIRVEDLRVTVPRRKA